MTSEAYTFDWPDSGRCHCLEVTSNIQHAFIVGEETDLEKKPSIDEYTSFNISWEKKTEGSDTFYLVVYDDNKTFNIHTREEIPSDDTTPNRLSFIVNEDGTFRDLSDEFKQSSRPYIETSIQASGGEVNEENIAFFQDISRKYCARDWNDMVTVLIDTPKDSGELQALGFINPEHPEPFKYDGTEVRHLCFSTQVPEEEYELFKLSSQNMMVQHIAAKRGEEALPWLGLDDPNVTKSVEAFVETDACRHRRSDIETFTVCYGDLHPQNEGEGHTHALAIMMDMAIRFSHFVTEESGNGEEVQEKLLEELLLNLDSKLENVIASVNGKIQDSSALLTRLKRSGDEGQDTAMMDAMIQMWVVDKFSKLYKAFKDSTLWTGAFLDKHKLPADMFVSMMAHQQTQERLAAIQQIGHQIEANNPNQDEASSSSQDQEGNSTEGSKKKAKGSWWKNKKAEREEHEQQHLGEVQDIGDEEIIIEDIDASDDENEETEEEQERESRHEEVQQEAKEESSESRSNNNDDEKDCTLPGTDALRAVKELMQEYTSILKYCSMKKHLRHSLPSYPPLYTFAYEEASSDRDGEESKRQPSTTDLLVQQSHVSKLADLDGLFMPFSSLTFLVDIVKEMNISVVKNTDIQTTADLNVPDSILSINAEDVKELASSLQVLGDAFMKSMVVIPELIGNYFSTFTMCLTGFYPMAAEVGPSILKALERDSEEGQEKIRAWQELIDVCMDLTQKTMEVYHFILNVPGHGQNVAKATQEILPFIMGCVLWTLKYRPENCEKAYLSMLLALGAFSKIASGLDILALSMHSVGLLKSEWSFSGPFDEDSWKEHVGTLEEEQISSIFQGQPVQANILERLTMDPDSDQEPRSNPTDLVEATKSFMQEFFIGKELELEAYSVACTFSRNLTSPKMAALFIGTNTYPRLSQLFEGLREQNGGSEWVNMNDLETKALFFLTLRLLITPMLAGGLGTALIQQGASEEDVNALAAHYDRWIAHEEMELDENLSNGFGRACSVAFWYAQRLNAPEEAMAAILDLKKQVEHESDEDVIPDLFKKVYLTLFQSLSLMVKAEGAYQPFIENGFVPIVVDLYGKTEDVFFGRIILDTLEMLMNVSPAQAIPELRKIKDLRTKLMKWWTQLDNNTVMSFQSNVRRLLEKMEKLESEL